MATLFATGGLRKKRTTPAHLWLAFEKWALLAVDSTLSWLIGIFSTCLMLGEKLGVDSYWMKRLLIEMSFFRVRLLMRVTGMAFLEFGQACECASRSLRDFSVHSEDWP